jgi:hypothetical protein
LALPAGTRDLTTRNDAKVRKTTCRYADGVDDINTPCVKAWRRHHYRRANTDSCERGPADLSGPCFAPNLKARFMEMSETVDAPARQLANRGVDRQLLSKRELRGTSATVKSVRSQIVDQRELIRVMSPPPSHRNRSW